MSISQHQAQRFRRYIHLTKLRSASLNLVLALASILITFLVGEGVLQLLYRVRSGEWLWADSAFRIEYTQPVEDRRQYSLRPRYNDSEAGISINQLGFREVWSEEVPNTPVIVCLGDSVPFGAGVRDQETYPAFLAKLLSSSKSSIKVINAGVPSYSLRQSFDRLRIDVMSHYTPSQIALVTVEAANDISLLTHYRADWTPDVTWAEIRMKRSCPPSSLQKVATFYYFSRLINRAQSGGEKAITESHQKYPGTKMLSNARQVLHKELTFYQDQSIPIVLMPVNPFYYQLSNQEKNNRLNNWDNFRDYVEDWDELIREYNALLEQVSLEFENIYFFDTRQVMDSQNRDEMYVDFIHYSPAGNKVIANALFDILTENELLPAGK